MARGGAREGAGRPVGKGPHGEKTRVMRIPLSLTDDVREFLESKGYQIPVFSARVPAGTPSSADDHIEDYVNLYKKLVPDPENIGLAYAQGDSMIGAGIFDGDLLLFNRKEEPAHRKIVIAMVNGEQTVKRLLIARSKFTLMPENEKYKPIPIIAGMEFRITGVVSTCLRML